MSIMNKFISNIFINNVIHPCIWTATADAPCLFRLYSK